MTFSPFYMGNHTTPFDDNMDQQSYTVAENWGMQLNFMVPLDGSLIERCKAIGARQQAKMELDYELVRVLKCGELQQKGFMIRPGTRVYHMCSDVIPIAGYKAELTLAKQKIQQQQCQPIEEFRFPWQKKRMKCLPLVKNLKLSSHQTHQK